MNDDALTNAFNQLDAETRKHGRRFAGLKVEGIRIVATDATGEDICHVTAVQMNDRVRSELRRMALVAGLDVR